MKKILQIAKYYYPFLGGTEQVARDIALSLKETDTEQKIICFNENATDGQLVYRKGQTVHEQMDGAEIIRCGCQAKTASQSLSAIYGRELKQLMLGFRPDVVILHYPNPFATYHLLRYQKLPFKLYVYWHLDITRQKVLRHLFYGQNCALIKRADRILGATPRHVNESAFSSRFGDKRFILPYMIDENSLVMTPEEIREGERIRAQYAGKTLGFFIGRHVPYKGLTYLIRASKELGRADIHFLIAGSGELTESLRRQAEGDPKVEFLGRITDSARRSFLYACDIICFPSVTRNEGFGLSLAEGMYFGKPAVTFTIPASGVNYVNLNGITGIECPNRDVHAYAEALRKLSENPSLREQYGAAARRRVLDHFTAARFRQNLLALLEIDG